MYKLYLLTAVYFRNRAAKGGGEKFLTWYQEDSLLEANDLQLSYIWTLAVFKGICKGNAEEILLYQQQK